MVTAAQQKALDKSHSKAARQKAVATMMKQATARAKLAKRFGEGPRAFTKRHLLATVERRNIPLAAVPVALFKPFPHLKRKELLAKRANGVARARGVGIPLDAIPAKPERKPTGAAAIAAKRPHPNSELIGKVLDQLARPQTKDNVAERLLGALDKLLSG